ncbi:uncharacterized protein VDAG_00206 [Verticillium dahliae VdLs.17]|uniref:Secreted protein n=1 Tax=Verticillium dahliae (strain VdLs.17 / ATCC MYA-4575 / FGSC 10137) TaxID=498257 RepID=G2WRM3_VERDV|nr:uncharacterized protein VDAG_00206 [Verticillium dahliae VdLs.17]EGY13524.1 hypothetical protein VDAG_00206 [Verticillium dahliae VdLs.17]
MAASWCAFWHCVTLAPLAELPWSDGPSAQADRQTQDQDPTTNGDSTALGTHARKTGYPNGSDSAKDPCCGCFLLSLRVVFNESSDARSHGTHISSACLSIRWKAQSGKHREASDC